MLEADLNNMIEIAKFFWMITISIASAGAWIYAWLSQKRSATLDRVEASERLLNEMAHRLTSLEKDVMHGPTHNDIQELHGRITDLQSSLDRLIGGIDAWGDTYKAMNEQLININSYLREHK
ncbi:MAG: DUF2730 family protein [Gammaproteobacteria bacterium]